MYEAMKEVKLKLKGEDLMVSQEGGKNMIEVPRDLKDPLLPPGRIQLPASIYSGM